MLHQRLAWEEGIPHDQSQSRFREAVAEDGGPGGVELPAENMGSGGQEIAWEAAEACIREQFGCFSEKMAGLADRSFRERWIRLSSPPGTR